MVYSNKINQLFFFSMLTKFWLTWETKHEIVRYILDNDISILVHGVVWLFVEKMSSTEMVSPIRFIQV